MNKKYELVKENTMKLRNGTVLYRIKSLKDFGNIKKGDLGGYIEKEENLSHYGICWVYDNARVYGNAQVSGNARVYGNAWVYNNAQVFGNALVYNNARVFDDARLYGNARVFNNAWISCNALVFDNAWVFDSAWVSGNARVSGDALVYNNARVSYNANISNNNDYVVLKGFGSENRSTTFYRTKDNGVCVVCGCFNGTLDEFISKVKETHGSNKYAKEYLLAIELIKFHFNN